MKNGFVSVGAFAPSWRGRLLGALFVAALLFAGVLSGSALAMKEKPIKTTWLCRPGA